MQVNKDELFARIRDEQDFFQKAKLIYYLRKNQEITIKGIAQGIGLTSAYVCHILRLLKLPEIIVDGYYSKIVPISQLFILARLKTKEEMIEAYETILSKNLNAPETENLVRKKLHKISTYKEHLTDEEVENTTKQLKVIDETLELKVIQTRIQGKIILEIKGDSKKTTYALRKILERLKGEEVEATKLKEKLFTLE